MISRGSSALALVLTLACLACSVAPHADEHRVYVAGAAGNPRTASTDPALTLNPSQPCGLLRPGEGLSSAAGGVTVMTSCGDAYRLVMQPDGNLVLYASTDGWRSYHATWSTQTSGTTGTTAVMQGDGNFVLYDASHVAIWKTDTAGNANSQLGLGTDGNLVVIKASGVAAWSSMFGLVPIHACKTLAAGDGLTPSPAANAILKSCSGAYTLTMRVDGSLVVTRGATPIWSSKTTAAGSRLVMQGDGNLIVVTPANTAAWTSRTSGATNAHLEMQDDGNLVLYDPSHRALWSSVYGLIATVAVDPTRATICPGVVGDITGATPVDAALQACVNAVPANGTLEIPAGAYLVAHQIQLTKPMTLRTDGTGSLQGSGCYYVPLTPLSTNPGIGGRNGGIPCATLKAAPTLASPGGVLYVGPPQPANYGEPTGLNLYGVSVDHVIVDANNAARWTGPTRSWIDAPNAWTITSGDAVVFKNCTSCQFTSGAAINALACACMSWYESVNGLVQSSAFVGCGLRNPAPPSRQGGRFPMIANGIDFKSVADNARVLNNAFVETTDVALGFDTWSAVNVQVQNNYFMTGYQLTYAEMMFDGQYQRVRAGDPRYDGTITPPVSATPSAPSDYTGGDVSGNYVNCHGRCDYGLLVGSHPWDMALPSAFGLHVHDNRIEGARRGLELDAAGMSDHPLVMDNNAVVGSFAQTIANGQTFGVSSDLTISSRQYLPVNCWVQDRLQCQADAAGRPLNACCTYETVSDFDVASSFATTILGGNPGASTFGHVQHFRPVMRNGVAVQPLVGDVNAPLVDDP